MKSKLCYAESIFSVGFQGIECAIGPSSFAMLFRLCMEFSNICLKLPVFIITVDSLFCCLQVMTFPATCGACAAACVTHMYVTSILIYNPTDCDWLLSAQVCDSWYDTVCGSWQRTFMSSLQLGLLENLFKWRGELPKDNSLMTR